MWTDTRPPSPRRAQTHPATLHEVRKLTTGVNETDDSCPRGGWSVIMDPLGCTLSLCGCWLDVLGGSCYMGGILKAKDKSEEKEKQCGPPDSLLGLG